MKSTGIERPVDLLGRVCIPKELRRTMDISSDDKLEIYTEGDTIVLKKAAPTKKVCLVSADAADQVRQLRMSYEKLGISSKAKAIDEVLHMLGLDV